MFKHYSKILPFMIFACFQIFLTAASVAQNNPSFSDPVQKKYFDELDRLAGKIANNKINPKDAVLQIYNSKYCVLYHDERAAILCASMMSAADKTARANGDGKFFLQVLDQEVKKNTEFIYSNSGGTASDGSAQALETARRLLSPQGSPPTGSNGAGSSVGIAFLKSSYISGMNKICIYDRLGSQVAITIGATQMCSQTLQ